MRRPAGKALHISFDRGAGGSEFIQIVGQAPEPTSRTPASRSGRRARPSCRRQADRAAWARTLAGPGRRPSVPVQQRHPGAMVESAARIGERGTSSRRQQPADFLRHRRQAGRRIAELVQRRRETAEIVQRRGRLAGGDADPARSSSAGTRRRSREDAAVRRPAPSGLPRQAGFRARSGRRAKRTGSERHGAWRSSPGRLAYLWIRSGRLKCPGRRRSQGRCSGRPAAR